MKFSEHLELLKQAKDNICAVLASVDIPLSTRNDLIRANECIRQAKVYLETLNTKED